MKTTEGEAIGLDQKSRENFERVIEEARNRFYPGWNTITGNSQLPKKAWPFYRVTVNNVEELSLALLARPPYSRVEFLPPGHTPPRQHRLRFPGMRRG